MMGNNKKTLKVLTKKGLVLAGFMAASTLTLTGCFKGARGPQGTAGTVWKSGTNVSEFNDAKVGDYFIDTDDYVLYQKGENSWNVVMENYGKPGATGSTGATGQPGSSSVVSINADGYWVIDGVPTTTKARGENGAPGVTPTIEINEEGYWVINDVPTTVKAKGEDGTPGTPGQPGSTPKVEINAAGYWVINDVDTTTKATPSTITIIDGYWYIDGSTTGVKAEGKDGNTWISGIVAPTTEGKVGDFYLNTDNYDVYEKKESGWEKIGNIKGADGKVVATTLPAYWVTYLDAKIKEINAKGESYGGNADSFIFITDQHLDGSEDYSAEIINYITRNTSIKKVFFGGDTLRGSANDNALLREYRNQFDDDLLVFGMRGNHDIDGNVTENTFYDIMVRPIIDEANVSDKLYYHYDNPAQKVRYIVTDSVASKSNNLTSNEQLEWMKERILELSSDWTTVIFHHGLWEGSKTATNLEYSIDGKLLVDTIDSIYDETRCTIAGIYSGHNHRDYVKYSEKGYALISLTTDSSDVNLSSYDLAIPNRVNGTTTEQAFDVVFINPKTNAFDTIRIGAGVNQKIEYTPNVPRDVESVSLNKISATTWINGNKVSLKAILKPTNAKNKNVEWSIVSGEELGTITSDGLDCVFTPGTSTGTVVVRVKTVDGEYTAECTITIVENATSVNITSDFTWAPGAIEHANGNVNTTGTNYTRDWVYSNLVDISGYDTLTFSHVQTTNTTTPLGYAFYDENRDYISGASNGGGTYDTARKTITIPAGAKYFRVMWMNTTHPRYDEATYGVEENFYCYGNIGDSEPVQTYPVTGVSLNKSKATVQVSGNNVDLLAAINPIYATNKEVVWSIISGEDLGTIETDGLNCTFIPGETAGVVIIQVKTVDGEFVATCEITIVSDLQNTSVNISSNFTWTPGAIEHANGNVNTTGTSYTRDWVYSNLVDISGYDTLTFSHVQTTNTATPLGYAFYDTNGNYISGASNGGVSYDTVKKTIEIPAGAKYFRVMWMNTTHPRYDEATNSVEENFYCYGNIGDSEPTIVVSTKGVSLDKTSEKVQVNGEGIQLTATVTPIDASNKEVVWSIISGEDLGTIETDGLNCTFIPGETAGVVIIQVKTVDGEFIATCTITIVDGTDLVNLTNQFTWTPGAILHATGVTNSTESTYARDWVYSELVDVSAYDTLTFSHIQTTNATTPLGYAFYGEDGNYISGASNGGVSYDTVEKTIEVPEGAKYFRVMWMNTTHSRYDAATYGVETNFYCYGELK